MHCNQLVISIFPTTKCIALPENKKTSRDWTNQSVKVNFYVWTNLFSWLGDLPLYRIDHFTLSQIFYYLFFCAIAACAAAKRAIGTRNGEQDT